ncbi:MAG: ECF-type sigma factor [Planctomycetota bacterium]
MADGKSNNLTELLHQLQDGDDSAMERLFPLVYDELKALAAYLSRNPNHTLQPTALVHEAYVRLMKSDPAWNDRTHFFNVAAMAMRQLLRDHARHHAARKRGGALNRVTFDERLVADRNELNLVAFDEALQQLEQRDERQARVVELRFIVGLSIEETAKVLKVSPRTVNVDWKMAQAWLRRAMDKLED